MRAWSRSGPLCPTVEGAGTILCIPRRDERGFTLIEIVIMIAILGILASVAVPAYKDLTLDAKRSACKGALGGLREAIQNWQAGKALLTGVGSWPAVDSVGTAGVVMANSVPPNPFQQSQNAPDSVVQGVVRGQVYGTRGGWAYNPSTGEIWPNTSTVIGGTGCGGGTNVGESTW